MTPPIATSLAALLAIALATCAATADASPISATGQLLAATGAIGQFNFGFGRRGQEQQPPAPSGQSQPSLLGGGATASAQPAVGDREASLDLLTSGGKATAQNYLNRGWAALSAGDKVGATAWYHKAAAIGATFEPGEKTPQNLASDLLRAGVDPNWLKPPSRSGPGAFDTRTAADFRDDRVLPSLPGGPVTPAAFNNQLVQGPGDARANERPASFLDAPSGAAYSRFSGPPPAGGAPANARGDDPKVRSDELLHQARKALAAGNADQATRFAAEAHRLDLRYEAGDDTPHKVQGLIGEHRRLLGSNPLAGPQGQSPQFKRAYTELLMSEADGLIACGDLDTAEQVARRAYQIKAELGSTARTPAQLLAQIASMQRQQAQPDGSQIAGAPQLPPRGNGNQPPHRLPEPQSSGESNDRKNEAVALLAQSRAAMARGDWPRAQRLALTAKSLNVPDDAFGPRDERPWVVLLDIEKAQRSGGVMQAGGAQPIGPGPGPFPVQPGVYRPDQDNTHVMGAQNLQPVPAIPPRRVTEGHRLFEQGQQALLDRKVDEAVELFRQAWKHERELDPATRNRLQTYLQDLAGNRTPAQDNSPVIDDVEAQQQVLVQQVFSDVSRELRKAEQMRERDPKGAIEQLKQLRGDVAKAEIRANIRDQQVSRIDRAIAGLERYIEDNRSQIDQDERNRQTYAAVENGRSVKIEIGEKLAEMVDEFNRLLDEHQFAEAESIARQARDLAPEEEVVKTMLWKVKFIHRTQTGIAIREAGEEGFVAAMYDVDRAGIAMDTSNPIQFPDLRYWDQLTKSRGKHGNDRNRRLTEADIQIYNALKTPVDVRFTDRPLAEVIHTLAATAGVNVHLDRQGLAAEGITSDTPVTINLSQPISLRSALNHILHELRLSYVVQDEVLKITSEQLRESDVRREVYNVADLVIPIPNFTPSYNMGMAAALRQAYSDLGQGFVGGRLNETPLQVASGPGGTSTNPLALGQMAPGGRAAQPIGFGPGGVSGGVQPDFDSLIDLITQTVNPTSWDEVGGPGSVVGFETNLSLVISQTQEVHDEIVDLLEQLRRLQDLQVTIEVRFITLNDSFFERIGVDFDFDIQDGVQQLPVDGVGPSVTIGLDPTGQPTADFDISFTQDSFTAAVPQFGGFDPATAANFGFAILGEIEAFFLIQAAQGDTRTNVMQAPKVTLFNGQQAFVSDTSQTPFVTSVIPVVGDFAAAHQPVIIVLTEGTSLSVQAVVSPDRRFVRLTIVPFFSKIGEVKTFTFNGKRSSASSQTSVDPDAENGGASSEDDEEVIEGTTVQLPTFSFVTVTTTVSVPDGGTVLLGGVKRLSEGRTERGVPMLNKLPYVNRLFKNVGIGRDTSSLMMMVTPRIIIQEEEEEKLGIGGFGTGSP